MFLTKLAIRNALCCGEAVDSLVETRVTEFRSFAFFLAKYKCYKYHMPSTTNKGEKC